VGGGAGGGGEEEKEEEDDDDDKEEQSISKSGSCSASNHSLFLCAPTSLVVFLIIHSTNWTGD